MEIFENYELWGGFFARQEKGLTEEEIAYWSIFHRWPLIIAVHLSMGQIPRFGKPPTEPDEIIQLEDFKNRFELAKQAAESGELVVEKIPDSRLIGYGFNVERLVPVRNFIKWARENYPSNYEPLFANVLSVYKSPEHSASGGKKGKLAESVKVLITRKAIVELEEGCRCHNSELARFLCKQNIKDTSKTKSNEKFVIVLPGINDDCYEPHFNEAVISAFKAKGIPLRNEPKKEGEPRGKGYCKRPGHKI